MSQRPSRWALVRHASLMLLGLALIAGIVALGTAASLERFKDPAPGPTFLILLATIGLTAAVTTRWKLLTDALCGRATASWRHFYRYFVVSRLLGFILPKDVSDLGSRTVGLTRFHQVPVAQAGASVLLDRLFDLTMVTLLFLVTIPFWLGWVSVNGGLALMASAILIVGGLLLAGPPSLDVWASRASTGLVHGLAKLSRKPPPDLPPQAFDRPLLFRAFGFSVVKFFFVAGRIVLICFALRLDIEPQLAILVTPVGQMAFALAFTPGGLGIIEAGWFGALSFAGVATPDAAAFAVGQRVVALVMIGILAAVSLLWVRPAKTRASR